MNYFKEQIELLLKEQEEDQKSFAILRQNVSLHERRLNGFSWYPIAIRNSEIGLGDFLNIEVERTGFQELDHQFKFGAKVALFSNYSAQTDYIEGVIAFIAGNHMRISLRMEELPEWTRNGKLGIDLLFDDNSYKEMFSALSNASVRVGEDPLTDILIGRASPQFKKEADYHNKKLNDQQNKAVQKILAAQHLAIVHGPPGTGKTTTLVAAVAAVIEQDEEQVLVVAPSNAAVDLLSDKLSKAGLNVLRIGNPARVSPEQMTLTLEEQMSAHESQKQIKELKKQADALRKMAFQYKRSFGKDERNQRNALKQEVRNIMKIVENTENYIINDIVSNAEVITATLVGANYFQIKGLKYKTIFIDEAAQALEPATWIPILKTKKVVFAGDHCQLPPTIKSFEAAQNGLAHTLFEKCVELHPEAVTLLKEQYRMHEDIMEFSSKTFYGGQLKASENQAKSLLFPEDKPILFIDTAGCGFDEKAENYKISNPEEAGFLLQHLSQYLNTLSEFYPEENRPNIAIISPYREQIEELQLQKEHYPTLKEWGSSLSINTIDSFQGQEREIVYISLVRSNTDQNIGFLSDIRRMNVAMTRAKKKLVVIGDSATLSSNSFYADFIEYSQQNNFYHSAWEFMN